MGKNSGTTRQVTEVKLPEWVEAASQNNYKFAQQIANKPYNPYLGDTVAPEAQGTKDAFELFYNTLGQGNEDYAAAGDLFRKQGEGILGLNRDSYMNPFIDEVESKALAALGKTRDQSIMANADRATSAKAFGGTRQAVTDAITNSETNEKAGMLSAGLRKDAFDTSSRLMEGDLGRFGTAAQGRLATGDAFNKQRLSDFSGLLGIGQQQRGFNQQMLDDMKGKFDDANNYDLERLNILLSSLGMSPYGKTENSTVTKKDSFDPAQFGLGLLSLFAGISDERTKERLVRIGDKMGVPIYEYQYKGHDERVRGPMAQDVEKVYPDAVIDYGGVKMVDREVWGILADA